MDNDDKRDKKRVTSMQDELKQRRERRNQQTTNGNGRPISPFPTQPHKPNKSKSKPKSNTGNAGRNPDTRGKVLTYQPRGPQRGAAESGSSRRERHYAQTGERLPRPRHTRDAKGRPNALVARVASFVFSAKLMALIVMAIGLGAVYLLFVRPNSYRIYVGDEHVVTISQGLIEEEGFIQQVSAIIEGQIGSSVYVLDTIAFVPRNTRGEILTVDQALSHITEQVDFLVQGATFVVNGQSIATVASRAEADSILREIASRTLPSTSELVDWELRNAHLVSTYIARDALDNRDAVMARLTQTSRETREHIIQTGQFLSTLSAIYQITIEEILTLNPGMGVNDTIQVGDAITVAIDVPFLDLATIEEYQVFEDIPAPLEHRNNPALSAGTTQVVQEGTPGQLRRVYTLTRQLGVEQSRQLTNIEYVIPPQAYIIEMGGAEGTVSPPTDD